MFFFGVKKFVGVKAFFLPFLSFFTCKVGFSRPYFLEICTFFTAVICFHGQFLVFFHGREKRVSRANFSKFRVIVTFLTEVFTIFFHVHQFFFHVRDLPKKFTGKK